MTRSEEQEFLEMIDDFNPESDICNDIKDNGIENVGLDHMDELHRCKYLASYIIKTSEDSTRNEAILLKYTDELLLIQELNSI